MCNPREEDYLLGELKQAPNQGDELTREEWLEHELGYVTEERDHYKKALEWLRDYGAQQDSMDKDAGILAPNETGYVYGIAKEALEKVWHSK